MRVGVNIAGLRPDGSDEEVYFRNVLETMRILQPETQYVLFTEDEAAPGYETWRKVSIAPALTRFFGRAAPDLERVAAKVGVDLVFSPFHAMGEAISTPYVLHALDLRECRFAQQQGDRRAKADLKKAKQLCEQAAAIVAPSRFVRQEFLELLEIPLDKVVVAPLGVDEVFAQPQPPIIARPYILAVGATNRFRGFDTIAEVFAGLMREIPHALVVAGPPGDAERTDWGPRVLRVETCPDNVLASLYQHCDVFLCAASYEGFAVTVLEAMKSGAPVVASRTGAIPEVAGASPVYCNAESGASIAAGIRRMLSESPSERESRVRAGRAAAAEFTWERCAWKTLSAFRRG